jgi:hypothetical protein
LEAEAEAIEDERLEAFHDAEALWNLDVGVIGAVIVLSALGASPVASCNGGGFGGHHQASHPYVAFYLPAHKVGETLKLVEVEGVGLVADGHGLARLYSDRDLCLSMFAASVIARRQLTDRENGG